MERGKTVGDGMFCYEWIKKTPLKRESVVKPYSVTFP